MERLAVIHANVTTAATPLVADLKQMFLQPESAPSKCGSTLFQKVLSLLLKQWKVYPLDHVLFWNSLLWSAPSSTVQQNVLIQTSDNIEIIYNTAAELSDEKLPISNKSKDEIDTFLREHEHLISVFKAICLAQIRAQSTEQ